jgi:hypothetical protein
MNLSSKKLSSELVVSGITCGEFIGGFLITSIASSVNPSTPDKGLDGLVFTFIRLGAL